VVVDLGWIRERGRENMILAKNSLFANAHLQHSLATVVSNFAVTLLLDFELPIRMDRNCPSINEWVRTLEV
jgi:hypothetical protein